MCRSIHSGCGGVLRTLRVVGAFPGLGAQRPGGPRLPGGGPHFSREMGRKRAGSPVIGRWLRWNRCRVDPATWVPRRLRRGSPTFFEESRGKEHQGQAPGPRVLWPLVATRWFLRWLFLIRQRGYFFRYPKTDLGRIFRKKYDEKHFLQKKVSKSGHVDRCRNSPTTETMHHNRQNERVGTSGP